jgi:hypothetical protein
VSTYLLKAFTKSGKPIMVFSSYEVEEYHASCQENPDFHWEVFMDQEDV